MEKYLVKAKKYFKHLGLIIFSYLFGLVIGSMALIPFVKGLPFYIFIIGGLVFYYPILAAIVVLLVFLVDKLERNPTKFCLLSLLIIPVLSSFIDYYSTYRDKFSIIDFILIDNVQERLLFAFFVTGLSALCYWSLVRFFKISKKNT